MQIRRAVSAEAAAKTLPELEGGKIIAKLANEIGGIDHAPMLALTADRDQSHLGAH